MYHAVEYIKYVLKKPVYTLVTYGTYRGCQASVMITPKVDNWEQTCADKYAKTIIPNTNERIDITRRTFGALLYHQVMSLGGENESYLEDIQYVKSSISSSQQLED